MNNIEQKWEKTLNLLKSELTPVSFDTWIYPLKPVKIIENKKLLKLSSNSDMAISILETRYMSLLEKSIEEAFKQKLKIEFVFQNENSDHDENDDYDIPVLTDELYLNPKYIFETFVVGGNNRFAHAASLAVSESPSTVYNPLFLYGDSGLGKTHLMHAIGHYILRQDPSKKVLYVSSEMFTNELIKAITEHKNIEFRNKYRKIDVLLIDDIQFLEGKVETQREFFHTFNTLYDRNKQIIISSDRPPQKLSKLDERLTSRFLWNVTADLQPPDYETRVAILRSKAEMENIVITNDVSNVISLIAEKIKYNVRELVGAWNGIISFSTLMNKPISLSITKTVLKDIISESDTKITVEMIKKIVCKHYEITIKDIESSKRSRNIAFPRQIAMYLCKELTGNSLPQIGKLFGGRDHTTVMHAHKKISTSYNVDIDLTETIDELIHKINSN